MKRFTLAVLVAVLLSPALAWSQGMLIVVDPDQVVRLPRPDHWHWHPPTPRPTPPPTPAATYKIDSLDIQAKLTDQVAQVQVSQTFKNTGSRQIEVAFVFPLPYDGAIDQMTLMVDGKEYPAQLLDAEKARKQYEDIVRKNKDPALLEWIGTGMFRTSVFPVPAGATRTVSLRYTQLLRMTEGVTDFLFPLSTAKYTSDPIDQIKVRLSIESGEEIKSVYSPTHDVTIKRSDDTHAVVTYEAEDEIPGEDFRLLYNVGGGKVSMKVLSYRPEKDEDGYFLLLASPRIKSDEAPPKKTVLFVLDRSGSMTGEKIEQARDSLEFVLRNLHEGDTFNIIAYDSQVELFRPELQRYDKKTRDAAIAFCDGIYAGGSTNIDGALKTTLAQLGDKKRPSYVIFLTDGLPTTGETNEPRIAENAREANKMNARLFTFGVGNDVNSRLLDKLARDNRGQSDAVRPNEDIEEKVSRLYRRIESPILTNVKMAFEFDDREASKKDVNRVYPKGDFDLFAGEQLVMVGRYGKSGPAKVTIRGEVNDREESYDFPAKLVKQSDAETYSFIERLWAMRRVGEILDELDLVGKNEELIEELVRLSTRHGILTPYTSFLADENTRLHDVSANAARADGELDALRLAEGRYGVDQRAFKRELQYGMNAAKSSSLEAAELGSRLAGSAMRPRSSAPMSTPADPSGYGGRGYGSYGGAIPADAYADQAESEAVDDAASRVAAMRQIGNRAFYQRGGQWVDSTVTEEQQKAPTRIQQFSKEYFELAKKHGREFTKYMVFDEAVLVNIAGAAYLIEP